MLKKKIKWFSTNQRNYYCIGICPEHGFVKGKIRVRKSGDEYYVIKTTKVVDTATYEELKEKHEESKNKRLIKSKRRLLRDTEEA
jgi:exonuclease family protein